MMRFVLLLRGVNVGKGRRLPMTDLRELLGALGYTGVRTLLNSGNAVFDSRSRSPAAHARAIHAAIGERLGLEVPVVVKSAASFLAAIHANPAPPALADHPRCLVAFAQEPSAIAGLAPLQALAKPPERFTLGSEAAYLQCAAGILDSPVAKALLGRAGAGITTRNWATVLRLKGMLEEGDG